MSDKFDHLFDTFERDRERLKKDYAFSVAVANLVQTHFPEKLGDLANGWHRLSIQVRADEGQVKAAVPRLSRTDGADGAPANERAFAPDVLKV